MTENATEQDGAGGTTPCTGNSVSGTADLYNSWLAALHRILTELEVTDSHGCTVAADDAFERIVAMTIAVTRTRKEIFFIGNGASASMASHFAADLCKNGHVRTRVFTDLSLVTAVANDCGVEDMFAVPLQEQGRSGDVLVAISSSGSSPNILKAVNTANDIGLTVITLSGLKPENPLRRLGTLNFYVAADTYGFTETAHAALLHHWIDLIVES